MAKLRVTLIDEVRDRRLKVDLPDDAAMEKLLPALAKKLGLPPAAYQWTHEATGRALGGDQTLASFGVGEGETLRLAAAREEAPVVPWLAGEEAVPIWQKVPVWAWGAIAGMVLLVAVVGAFLVGRGAKQEPTPAVAAALATPAATEAPTLPAPALTATPSRPTFAPTSTPLPTATPIPPTATSVPPTNTPVPPTATPVLPTPTSALKATPIPADPWGQVTVPPGGTIHIGLVADFSGEANWFGPVTEGAVQMATDDQGSVKGFPVSITIADGGCQNAMGAAAAQAMVSDPTIVGVIGHTCSVSCTPGASVYEGVHLVMISPSCTAPDLSGRGYQVFNRVAIRDDQGDVERSLQLINTDVYQDFARRYLSRYGQYLNSREEGAFYVGCAYDATLILIKAIEQVAVVDASGNLVIARQALANTVRATSGYQGVTGVISFDSKGDRLP